MKHPKQKRHLDLKFREWVRQFPCVICDQRPVDVSHLKTKGSGGGDAENIVPKCRKHHIVWGTSLGREKIEREYGDLTYEAREFWKDYVAYRTNPKTS